MALSEFGVVLDVFQHEGGVSLEHIGKIVGEGFVPFFDGLESVEKLFDLGLRDLLFLFLEFLFLLFRLRGLVPKEVVHEAVDLVEVEPSSMASTSAMPASFQIPHEPFDFLLSKVESW